MKYTELDTPSLLIDKAILESNLRFMQDYANAQGVALRPHTKTHKMPAVALMQAELGAAGIAVAKVGEAEVMAEHGLRDILIANEIVGETKLKRIRALAEQGISAYVVNLPYKSNSDGHPTKSSHSSAAYLLEYWLGVILNE